MLQVIMKRECVVATATQGGGIYETLEMSNICAEHGIFSDVEVIPIQRINEAYEHVLNSDVRYHFAIDIASLDESVKVCRI